MPAITILNSNPTTGVLTLKPGGTVLIPRNEIITWVIGPGSHVKLISNIDVKKPSPVNIIWKEKPHRLGSSNNWQAVIDASTKRNAEYNYFISWIPEGSNEIKIFDPKIAVKPDGFNFKILIITLVSIFTAIFSVVLFSKRKNRKD